MKTNHPFNFILSFALAFLTLLKPPAFLSQSSAWQTYRDAQAGYSFQYPSQVVVTAGQNESDSFHTVNAAFRLPGVSGYQGMLVEVLPDAQGLSLADVLKQAYTPVRPAQAGRQSANASAPALEALDLNGQKAYRVADQAGSAESGIYVPAGKVVYHLAVVHDSVMAQADPQALALFEQIAGTFRVESEIQSVPEPRLRPDQASSTAPLAVPQVTNADFAAPLGFRDGNSFAPHQTFDGGGNLIEDTRYGVKNPDLDRPMTCFGLAWDQLYHAGEDFYRTDGSSTYGEEVTSVADGVVYDYDSRWNYPGAGVVIEHTLAGGQKVYSVYMHIENVAVVTGQAVKKGQRVGTVMFQPYTGKYPQYHQDNNDSHLHFEMRLFADARQIYGAYPGCNMNDAPGRGYTYPQTPDYFPTYASGYRAPASYLTPPVVYTQHLFLPQVSSLPVCAPSTTLLINGGFEEGQAGWQIAGNDIITNASDANLAKFASPHSGAWLAWLGGYMGASDAVAQNFSLPDGSISMKVSYYAFLHLTGTPSSADVMLVMLRDGSGNLIQQLDRVDPSFPQPDTWVRRAISLAVQPDWQGRPLRVSFEGVTGSASKTNFLIDDAAVAATCAP